MAASESFREYVLEQMEGVAQVTARRMFGGVGIYSASIFFALIDNDTLFFKVDDENRMDYVARRMEPFRPRGDDSQILQYYEVPPEVLEDTEELRRWMEKSVAVARRARSRKARRRKPA